MLHTLLVAMAALATVLSVTPVFAQDVATIVSLEGKVEVGQGDQFTVASVGTAVASGDTIRTGNPGRARVVFQDDSVLNISDGSTLTIDESVFDPNQGTVSTVLSLFSGKVRALVSEYYSEPRASFEIETPNSVSGVRGTEFVVAYVPEQDFTEVLGLGGAVAVRSPSHPRSTEVIVRGREITTIEADGFPTPPRQIDVDDERYQRLLAGLEMPGGGVPESLFENDLLLGGAAVPVPDRAELHERVDVGASKFFESPQNPQVDDQPDDPAHAGNDLLDQPLPILDGPTDLEIKF
ncbi:MAG: hypothetical protein ACI8TX_003294 [Hyphomicrobiaceae bacterium]|jgi:hypothetical protein